MITAIIQARMGSSRLPGKVMMEVNGRPLLDYLLERVQQSKLLEKIVFVTPDTTENDLIAAWCLEKKTDCYRGDETHLLGMYYHAATEHAASLIVRLTGDNPIIDPEIIDIVIQYYLDNVDRYDYVSNGVPLPTTYPDGMNVEVFSYNVLSRSFNEAKLPSEIEHVTFYMWRTGNFRSYRVDMDSDYSKYRLTVDYLEDFEVVKQVIMNLYHGNAQYKLHDIVTFLEAKPELLALQRDIKRHAGWVSAFKRDFLMQEAK